VQIQGYFDLRFEAVRDAFAALFDDAQERGAALCVKVGGETVVDLWAGVMDKDGQQAWHSDTIANLFSCTKPFAAVAALQLVGEGKLDLDAPVARTGPSSLQPARHASACVTCSATRPACRRCARHCPPKRCMTGRP